MLAEGDGFDAPVLEGLLWGALLLGAAALAVRSPRGARIGWLLIAAGLLLIVVDKAFDVHAIAHAFGQWIAIAVDPENQLRGPNAVYRDVALGTIFVAVAGAAAWVLRRDTDVGRDKVLCYVGLCCVGALLALRLAPGIEERLHDYVTKAIELIAWSFVLAGEWTGTRRSLPKRRADGFVDLPR